MIALLLACHHAVPDGPVDATVTGESMGGDLRIVVRCPDRADHPLCLDEAIAARTVIEDLHAKATDWTPEGEVYRLDAAAGQAPVPVSTAVAEMLTAAKTVRDGTEGAFDVTIGALWGLWDFDAHGKPTDAELAAKLPLVGGEVVVDDGTAYLPSPGMAVTLGGIAQGYAAQHALAAIPEGHEAVVDVSGDLCVRGGWDVGIQDPRGPRGATIASLTLSGGCLSTSGDYEHYFDEDGVRYHHILDPRTGQPGRGAISATVVGDDGAVVDALATALIILGPRADIVDRFHVWAYVITPDGAPHTLGGSPHVASPER